MNLTSTICGSLCVWLLCFYLPGYSQEDDSLKNYLIDEVMISATRTEKRVLDIPKSVSVITKQEIKSSGAVNLAELLSSQEGINVIGANQNPGSNQSFFMRGCGSEQSIVMIDGIRISDPSSNTNTIDLSEISLIDVNRIEIVRGTHSTLYGSSAIGGVINIITEKGSKPGLNGGVNADLGRFGPGTRQLNEAVNLNYTFKNGIYVTGKLFRSDVNGMDAVLDTITTDGTFKNNDRDNFTKTDLVSKVGYSSQKIDAFVSFRNISQFSDLDGGAFINDENNTIDLFRQMLNYNFRYKINDKLKLWLNGGGSNVIRTNEDDSSLIATDVYNGTYYTGTFEGKLLNNELQLNYSSKNLKLVLGTGIYRESMTSNTYTYSRAWDYESGTNLDTLNLHSVLADIFFSADINGEILSERIAPLSAMLGVRFNNDDRHGKYITYEFNPYLKFSKNSMLYGSIASGFNASPLYKLYTPESNYISGITRGNPDLKPERSFSYEAGIKQVIGKNIVLTLSTFKNVVKNSVQYVYLWDKNIVIDSLGTDWMRDDLRGDTYLNLGTMTTRGIECSIWANLAERITIRGNLNFQDGRLEYQTDEINQKQTGGNHVQLFESGKFLNTRVKLNRMTRRSGNYNVAIDYKFTKSTNGGINMNHVGKKNDIFYSMNIMPYGALDTKLLDGYTLFNLFIQQKVSNNVTASFRIENLFNKRYTELLGYNTRGFGMYVNLDVVI